MLLRVNGITQGELERVLPGPWNNAKQLASATFTASTSPGQFQTVRVNYTLHVVILGVERTLRPSSGGQPGK